jgi:hypothetical protein
MAVFKSSVEVHDASDRAIGAGMTYVHLRLSADQPQMTSGTISLKHWEPQDELPTSLRLADGRRLSIEVSRQVVSECSRNHILRYQAVWPPEDAPIDTPSSER